METSYLGAKRLVLQCTLLEKEAVGTCLGLAEDSPRLNDLHLTVLHVGKSINLFHEIEMVSGIELGEYEYEMVHFIEDCVKASLPVYDATISGLEEIVAAETVYGVLRIAPSQELHAYRTWCRSRFVKMISNTGVSHPEEYIARSKTIAQYDQEWLPHVTLSNTGIGGLVPRCNLIGNAVKFGAGHIRRSP